LDHVSQNNTPTDVGLKCACAASFIVRSTYVLLPRDAMRSAPGIIGHPS